MNQKKCPKCGESNPQEAVMCWACYTPLAIDTAGLAATATARGQAPAQPLPPDDDKDRAGIAPWQIGLGLAGLLLAAGVGFMMTQGGSSTPTDSSDNVTVGGTGGGGGTGVVRPPVGIGPMSPPSANPPASVPMPNRPTNVPMFRMTTGPSRSSRWATIGIVPTASVSGDQAVQLARNARTQVTNGRNFQGVHVFVFSDAGAASAFNSYQKGRGGAPLGGGDYAALADVWPKTLLRYEFSDGREDVRTPSAGDWWSSG